MADSAGAIERAMAAQPHMLDKDVKKERSLTESDCYNSENVHIHQKTNGQPSNGAIEE